MAADKPLPEDLTRRVFSNDELIAAGVTEWQRKGALWVPAFRGRHVWAATDARDPMQRIREAAALLPSEGAVGGWAAAHVLGARELDGIDPVRAYEAGRSTAPATYTPVNRGEQAQREGLLPVPLCVGPGQRIRPRPGLRLLRSVLDPDDVVVVDGIPVTTAVRTAYDIARDAAKQWHGRDHVRRLMDAVADVDAVLRDTRTELDEVADYCRQHPRWRGMRLARQVLGLCDPRAASRPESAFRVVWVVAAGLPQPRVNWPVYDEEGFTLAVVDLLDVEASLAGEYDGAGHRGLEQHTRDNLREEQLEHCNLLVVRATSLDLYRWRPALVRRIRAGWARGLARDRARDRWSPAA